MKKIFKASVWLWTIFALTFLLSMIMAVRKSTGELVLASPYLYLVGPGSFFLGVAALVVTSAGCKRTTVWTDPAKGFLIRVIVGILEGLAAWLTIMGLFFLLALFGLMRKEATATVGVVASVAATLVYLFEWSKIRTKRFLSLLPVLLFLSLAVESFRELMK
ncbi:MAG: hypothetical protein HY597_02380 [Candidatus Omnitrophica bacterium]|nr:hypothetical protein [Candidatus Omnitrophota bacterium]